jgi:ubiquinone/menaquinone biosynthesis C-methylase UbiE
VLAPVALRLIEGTDTNLVLDIGTGTGDFTSLLANVAREVISVDPSGASVKLAKDVCREHANVSFVVGPLEECVSLIGNGRITSAVAAMTLMTTPNLEAFASALASVLGKDGRFVATLVHPWFWPRYWGYESKAWFDYKKEMFVEAPFEISFRKTQILTTHIHRPLERYFEVFESAGFAVDSLLEPMPHPDVERQYPRRWHFPRFVALRWVKIR